MLTRHGGEAIARLGAWQRDWLLHAGLLNGAACPAAGMVFAWASPLPRTRDTARAFLDALLPNCATAFGHASSVADDGLFHPLESRRVRLDPARARAAVLAAMGGGLDTARQSGAGDVRAMEALVGKPAACENSPCGLSGLPWEVRTSAHKADVAGPLRVGAVMGETIRMQYADGWPLGEVAFGAVTKAADVKQWMALRAAKYAVLDTVPYLAQRGGSQLMSQVLAAIDDDRAVGSPPADARLLIFVGHDGNIAQLRSLLGFDWQLSGYPENDPVPGGMLVFERWRDTAENARDRISVRVRYVAQSLDQLRGLTVLSGKAAPLSVTFLPAGAGPDGRLPRSRFDALISAAIDWSATFPASYASPVATASRGE
ncbi:4-phytase / acid phosphatase [Chitinasiproducens palmae]|uniref:4-phytase / acid phosphatase n=2 Tax=Chitinasiproducens palmae TaxID=1770053 RepID=A0A1H2PKF7_9BURK|nr:4-phytase / acid phosphatase [Chitinasiproducens palmae]